MKTLIFARHAKSTWDNPDWTDFERPLNKRGLRNLPIMAGRLKEHLGGAKPQLISSPAVRALITAKGYADELGISHEEILEDIDFYNKGMHYMLDIINELDENQDTVMIIGHNPTMTSIASFSTGQHFQNVPTCGIVIVDYQCEKWIDLKIDSGQLREFDFPKKKKDEQ